MISGLLGRKVGMTQVFMPDGVLVPCTVIEVGPCPVIQMRTREQDGYEAVQIGFLPRARGTNKPLRGHFTKHNAQPLRHLREFKATGEQSLSTGDVLTVDVFTAGERVDVAGVTKGRGFAGVVKRYGFRGNPGAHGTHETFRGPGSVGSAAHPSHTPKGKRLAGHYGVDRKMVRNLLVVRVEKDRNLLLVKGAVPGSRGGLVEVRRRG
ncbi:MAG: 50S ribosomal protein L3 [Pyrinomonadaceae bacterium]|jgi:large subunit ribosomal protein L3|nr:50S ribosomal protein L3 [Pyrinomonadaceae bacterium]